MHVYFSGIGGAGIGPLAIIAKQAGYKVSGSDAKNSNFVKYLTSQGFSDVHVGQDREQIARVHTHLPIDWLVYTSALPSDHPELIFAKQAGIKISRRDEFINEILSHNHLKLIAIAGTHGKTTTTAMLIWLFKQLATPISYSVGAKISFGEMGHYDPKSQYFVYEADEYDHNFLAFRPFLSTITGVDWDHPDTYPTREEYNQAFKDFIGQSDHTVIWQSNLERLKLDSATNQLILDENDQSIEKFSLKGLVNRQNAWMAANAVNQISDKPLNQLIDILNKFPGLGRRFEQIAPNIYSDYAHTPIKIEGALQLAHEEAGNNVVVVYEGIHNLRQHFIKEQLKNIFDKVKQLYIVPTYLGREDPNLAILSPQDLKNLFSSEAQKHTQTAILDDSLKSKLKQHADNNDIVLCLSAGGAGGLDEWLRREFS